MSVKVITKTKEASRELAEEATEVDALVHSFFKLEERVKKFRAGVLKEYEEAKAEIIRQLEYEGGLTPSEGVEVLTEKHVVKLSKRGIKREVTSIPGVREVVGEEVFDKICRVPLKELDNYLTVEQVEGVTESTWSGPRRLSVTKIK